MHVTCAKIIGTQPTSIYNNYKNTCLNLLKKNAATFFLTKNVKPSNWRQNANIKIKGNNRNIAQTKVLLW